MFGFRVAIATLHLPTPFLSAVPKGSSRSWNVEAEFVFLVRSDLQNEVLSPLSESQVRDRESVGLVAIC